ncbi:hypothetical protein SKAU_G00227150 [Synaphobranchus kaupii]|uniref:Uncharacterized protein n=1 Tax=Synaphobranchus kaupii TaxID=118154 RepID=A0A9Q1F5B2_SYNKA|nr:hypothetical protein SKAU_G00227150 [Synaphobranchus kaupii]
MPAALLHRHGTSSLVMPATELQDGSNGRPLHAERAGLPLVWISRPRASKPRTDPPPHSPPDLLDSKTENSHGIQQPLENRHYITPSAGTAQCHANYFQRELSNKGLKSCGVDYEVKGYITKEADNPDEKVDRLRPSINKEVLGILLSYKVKVNLMVSRGDTDINLE